MSLGVEMERKIIRVTVFDNARFDGDWPPENASECMAWFEEKIAAVPAEYRGSARIEFDTVSEYGGEAYANISITYDRPETDKELSERIADAERRKSEKEMIERMKLAELKAKYEGRR